uniref:(northern house mosquito) hypothetical protein n=1 Tax=Culex pipiens TaxID=7175 RepID=A0A8D8BE77_CULPI
MLLLTFSPTGTCSICYSILITFSFCVCHASSSLKFTYFLPLSASECSSTWESGFCLCVCVLLGCVCLQCISGQNDTYRKEVEFCSNCAICERSTRVTTI